jgi:Ca2+-binding RTX toxin-like protein
VSDGLQNLLLDPTIGLVVYGVTFEGLLNADRYDDMKSFISRNELNSFNDNVIKAVSTGLYHPKDVIYKFDTINDLYNNWTDELREGLNFIDREGNNFFIGTLFNDTLTFDSVANRVYGGKGNDTIWLGGGNDYCYGGLGHDTLFGQTGRDILYGEEGNDRLYGQLGNDILSGGDGNDWLVGNAGADRLTGGKGADTFRYQSIFDSGRTTNLADTIFDFSSTDRDKIDISEIDANLITYGNQEFKFIGHNKFDAPGQIRVFYTTDETRIICNIDSNVNSFEFLIRLSGNHEFSNIDFIL